MTQIKTLSEILAEMGQSPVSANQNHTPASHSDTPTKKSRTTGFDKRPSRPRQQADFTAKHAFDDNLDDGFGNQSTIADIDDTDFGNDHARFDDNHADHRSQSGKSPTHHHSSAKPSKSTKSPRKQAKSAPLDNTSQIESLLTAAKQGEFSSVIDDKLAQALQNTAIEPLAINDRGTNYMRWLAFYYLSRRELSQHQLRQKLLAKECDADAVEALLVEFAEKNYQSDERCAYMLIRESVRKSRGKQHIRQALKDAKLTLSYSLDELIANAGIDEMADGTILENQQNEQVDWLLLAVEARCKKYGNDIPTTPKEKARQLRFLQYRGFDIQICFDALKYRPEDLLTDD